MTVRFVIAIVALAAASALAPQAAPNAGGADCPETPVSARPPNAWMGTLSSHWLRNGTLWMGYTRADDSFVARPLGQKIGWFRGKGSPWGRLRVSGRRLDGAAPPLVFRTGVTYPFREGFQPSSLTFSTAGCWQIVARVGLRARYVFVVRVEADDHGA
jgi:hypothetical protein